MILTFHKNKLKEIFKFIWFIIKLDASFNLCLFKQNPVKPLEILKQTLFICKSLEWKLTYYLPLHKI